jgi:hypothetical protein
MKQSLNKVVRFLCSDATSLSIDAFQDIINSRYTMKHAAQIMAKKYKISMRHVYQIWRNNQPPTETLTVQAQASYIDNAKLKEDKDLQHRFKKLQKYRSKIQDESNSASI